MASDVSCGIDNFAKSLEEILGKPVQACNENIPKAVAATARSTAKKLRGELTEGIGVHEWSEEYRGGFKSYTTSKGGLTEGEVGNKNKPGLVHLLENGHATPTGRRTRAFKHMDPAMESAEKELVERVEKALGESFGG